MIGRASLADVPFFLSDSYLPGFIRWLLLYPQSDKSLIIKSSHNTSVKDAFHFVPSDEERTQ